LLLIDHEPAAWLAQDRVLVDEGIDEDSDASSVSEVVERVKASYKEVSDTELADAKRTAELKDSELVAVHSRVALRVRVFTKIFSWSAAVVMALVFLVGTVMSLVATVDGTTPSLIIIALAIVPLAAAGVLSLWVGFHLKAWRRSVDDWLFRHLKRWLVG
jgi:hypothetical protein